MFVGEFNAKYALLIGNHMKDCHQDVDSLEKILLNYNFDKVYKYKDCSPEVVLSNFLFSLSSLSSLFKKQKDVLIYIHYSGHGVKRGLRINDKVEILSCWLNERNRIFSSYDFYLLLNKFFNTIKEDKNKNNFKMIITSDSCHSGEFDRYLRTLFPKKLFPENNTSSKGETVFISSSPLSLITLPKKDKEGSVKGIIVTLFEQLIKEGKEISVENLLELSTYMFKKKKIKNNIIIR